MAGPKSVNPNGVIGWALTALKRSLVFEGRSGQREYWSLVGVSFGVAFALNIVAAVVGAVTGIGIIGLLGVLVVLAMLPALVAVFIRRLHDTDRAGIYALALIVPLVNLVAIIYLGLQESASGSNEYGTGPLSRDAEVDIKLPASG